jgi:hypothetical protein
MSRPSFTCELSRDTCIPARASRRPSEASRRPIAACLRSPTAGRMAPDLHRAGQSLYIASRCAQGQRRAPACHRSTGEPPVVGSGSDRGGTDCGVAQRMFSDKNQAEIGAMLGKSSDWVSMRARIHNLPEALKERQLQRPRAISQMLELGTLYTRQPAMAGDLTDRVIQENLTLEVVRHLVRGYARPEKREHQVGANTPQAAPKQSDTRRSTAQRPGKSGATCARSDGMSILKY